jgi:hypothetical protein
MGSEPLEKDCFNAGYALSKADAIPMDGLALRSLAAERRTLVTAGPNGLRRQADRCRPQQDLLPLLRGA